MNAGVEIILERIKTHPEEFCIKGGGKLANGKWSRVLENYGGHLEQEDINALNEAIDKIQQEYFTEEVMTILIDGRDVLADDDDYVNIPAQKIPRAMPFAGEIKLNNGGTTYPTVTGATYPTVTVTTTK
jgi:hypothetical protein